MHDEPLFIFGVTPEDWAQTPETVRVALRSVFDIMQAQGQQLREFPQVIRDLQAKLGQSSQNSSKPPSSDLPSAPGKPPRVPRGRKAGGQPGHEGHHRPLVPPERVDEAVELRPEQCPHCQAALAADRPTIGGPRRTQVWELPVVQPHSTEFRQHTCCCPGCRELVTAALPPDAPPGGFGPCATAWMAILRGRFRLSIDDTAECLTDLWNLPISAASIVTGCARTSDALAPGDAAIQAVVQAAPSVNADETSWPTETRTGWLWVAVCAIATCFRIHRSRSGPAMRHLLGDAYRGSVGSDRYVVYDQFADQQRQLCGAHLVRNRRGLLDAYADETRWAQSLLDLTDDLFIAWHLSKGGWIDQVALPQALIPIRIAMRTQLQDGVDVPYPKIAGFSHELLGHWEALWTFSRVEGIEPTNNAAEQAVRHAVLWRKGSFGSRSEAGCRFVERMRSVHATCRQQERSLVAFVTEAVQAAWAGTPPPVLVTPPATA